MKKLGFLLVGTASLALAACGGKDSDTLNESEAQNIEANTLNESEAQNVEANALNDLAANAAEMEVNALGEQQAALNAENTDVTAPTADDNLTSPSKVEDDVQGM